jgi:prepilin-type N-terminal cleavage/methylation domain-containing protein/prepilin-type processing-associated H-X9-DG protein
METMSGRTPCITCHEPRHADRCGPIKAFTLIELLVVIAIVGLLMSVLLPSLHRAREMAKESLCKSNLRQLSHGWHGYADDHNDVAVPGRFFNAGGGTSNPANWYDVGNGLKYRPRWIATMGKYVGLFAFHSPSTENDRQDYDSDVYRCPTVPDRMDERNHAFGYNHQFLGNARQTNNQFYNFPVSRSRIRNFAQTVLAADSMGTAAGFPRLARQDYAAKGTEYAQMGNHAWSLDPPRLTDRSDRGSGDASSPRTAVDPRHDGKGNIIFCDGHAESITPYDLGYRILGDGRFVEHESVDQPPRNHMFSGSGHDSDPPDRPR